MSRRPRQWLQRVRRGLPVEDVGEGQVADPVGRHVFADLPSFNATLSQLQQARQLLAKPNGWTQGSYARDRHGVMVDSRCSEATAFCASGALYATQDDLNGSMQARTVIYRIIADDIEVWNDADGRSQADIVRAFDQAIAWMTRMARQFAG